MGKQPFSPPSQWWYSIILQTHLALATTVYIMSWAYLVLFFIGKEWTCMAVLWQCEELKYGAKSIFCCQNTDWTSMGMGTLQMGNEEIFAHFLFPAQQQLTSSLGAPFCLTLTSLTITLINTILDCRTKFWTKWLLCCHLDLVVLLLLWLTDTVTELLLIHIQMLLQLMELNFSRTVITQCMSL